MLFKENSLSSPFSILDEAIYISEKENMLTEDMIPLVENSRLNTILVDSRYIDEDTSIGDNVSVVVNEEDAIMNPSILHIADNVVIRPISPFDEEYIICNELCEQWLIQEANDHHYDISYHLGGTKPAKPVYDPYNPDRKFRNTDTIDSAMKKLSGIFGSDFNSSFVNKKRLQKLINQHGYIENMNDKDIVDLVGIPSPFNSVVPKKRVPKPMKNFLAKLHPEYKPPAPKGPSFMQKNGKRIGIGLAVTAGAAGLAAILLRQIDKRPQTFIGKRIAALRAIYRKWMEKARSLKNTGVASLFKKGSANLLYAIDKLLAYVQNSSENINRNNQRRAVGLA